MLRSEPFFKLLRVLTDLELAVLDGDEDSDHSNGDDVNSSDNNKKDEGNKKLNEFTVAPSCIIETRQWKHGCFTILDDDQFESEDCLDCIFNIGCEGNVAVAI